MQTGEFLLTPETLRRFVPFDELTPEARAQLVPQAEIVCVPERQQVSETVLDSGYTLYLLDGELALIAGDRLVDTLRAGTPISRFPLSRLRSGQLDARANTTVRLLRIRRDVVSRLIKAEARPQSPNQPHSPPMGANSDTASGILAAMEAVTPPTLGTREGQQRLNTELERAEAEIELALQDKAEATIARRLWASSFHGFETPAEKAESPSLESQMAQLLAKQARLEEQSRNASNALSKAQRRKAEIEAALRTVDTRRAQAIATGDQPHHKSEAQGSDEEQQLEDRRRQVSMKLEQLEKTRQTAIQRLEEERKQLEENFATTRRRLQGEAADIQAALVAAWDKAAEREGAMPETRAVAQERVRGEVETRLRQARIQLETELNQSELALRAAQQELDAAHLNKQAAEQEAQQLAERLQANKRGVEDDTVALSSPRGVATSKASVGCHGDRVTAELSEDDAQSSPEDQLHARLEAIERKLVDANSEIAAAARATEKAALAKCQVEEQVARHRAVEDELRLEVHEENEVRLRAECQRSEEKAAASAALVEAMGAYTLASAGRLRVDGNEGMLGDIRQQLKQAAEPPPLTRAMQNKIKSERRAAMVRDAQEKAKAERLKAKRDLQRAREHLIELRSKTQKTPPSDPD